jgi:hypothetical protein
VRARGIPDPLDHVAEPFIVQELIAAIYRAHAPWGAGGRTTSVFQRGSVVGAFG